MKIPINAPLRNINVNCHALWHDIFPAEPKFSPSHARVALTAHAALFFTPQIADLIRQLTDYPPECHLRLSCGETNS